VLALGFLADFAVTFDDANKNGYFAEAAAAASAEASLLA